jgi:hypothetical protein
MVRGFNAGLPARSQFASGRSCDRPTRSRFSVVFLGTRANAELVPKSHVALHASHAALPMVTLKISPCTNVTLTFHFDSGLDHPVHGGYGWGRPTPRRRSNCNLKLNLRHCAANYRPVLSSESAPYMKNKESNCHSNKCNILSLVPKGARHQDELADWPSVVMWLRLQTKCYIHWQFIC